MDASAMERFEYSELRIINNRRRRNRELKRHILMLVFGILAVIILSIVLFSNRSVASDGSGEVLYKYYKSVKLNPGDTLYDLADGYSGSPKAFINEVMFVNSLEDPSDIKAGEYIVIPYHDVLR